MGCDIHLYVERKTPDGWASVDQWDETGDVVYEKQFFSDRSYNLFGVLAGIRTSDIARISEPRGLPEGLSAQVREAAGYWSGDAHSHSWFTLAELLAFDWNQTYRDSGWVSPVGWAEWKGRGKPSGWCGAVGGGVVRHLEEGDFSAAWDKMKAAELVEERAYPQWVLNTHTHNEKKFKNFVALLGGGSPYCFVEWDEPVAESVASSWWISTVPRLLALGQDYENTRVVFWFDN